MIVVLPSLIPAGARINSASYHDSDARGQILKKYPFKVRFVAGIPVSVPESG